MTNRDDEKPKPYLDECGCIITTQGQIEHLPHFEKRVRTRITTTFCAKCRVKYGGASMTQDSSFLVHCKLCKFLFWMGIAIFVIALVNGAVVAYVLTK